MTHSLRIATRNSPLALKQTEIFANRLKRNWPKLEIKLIPMTTQGDQLLDKKLQYWGGKGLFVKELEQAMLENRADIAVHSMKDVPAQLPSGLSLACICQRDNPLDALVTLAPSTLLTLPKSSRIGTASLRRQAQLLALRPDFQIETLRGNIHTRLEKLKTQSFDAIILACAGLERMAFENLEYQPLDIHTMLPACGQGAIGIECRTDDKFILNLLSPLHHPQTAICVETERMVNAYLGGHCHVPIAIFAQIIEGNLDLKAKVLDSSGKKILHFENTAPLDQAKALAKNCADNLIEQGALELIKNL